MAHLFESGFTVRKAAWHGLGTVLDEAPDTWEIARKAAGLMWEPKVVKSFYLKRVELVTADDVVLVPTVVEDGVLYSVVQDTTGNKVLRDDSERVLGSGVGKDWTPVPNSVLGEFAEALVEAGGKLWTAGSLAEGRKVYVTIMLDEPYHIGNDERMVKFPFLAVTNAHDGAGSFLAQYSTFEVVCANTAKRAEMEGEREGRQFVFRHTANVMERIEEAKLAIEGARADAMRVKEIELELFGMPIGADDVETFLDNFAPTKVPDLEGATARVRGNAVKARESWKKAFESPTIAEDHRATALGLVRASTEFCDHLRGFRSTDSYAYRSLLKVEPLKAQAVKLARLVAAH
jgi:phage/plasmid-like protein (TIGR03299 family)